MLVLLSLCEVPGCHRFNEINYGGLMGEGGFIHISEWLNMKIHLVFTLLIVWGGILVFFAMSESPNLFKVKGETKNVEIKAFAAAINKSIEMVHVKAVLENKASSPYNTVFFLGEDVEISLGYPIVSVENLAKMMPKINSSLLHYSNENVLLLYLSEKELVNTKVVSKTNLPKGCYVAVFNSTPDSLTPPSAKLPREVKC